METRQAKEKAEGGTTLGLEPSTRLLALVSAAAGILAVTLFPVRTGLLSLLRAGRWPDWSLSAVLSRTEFTGLSDCVFNVLLFLPLGCFALDPATSSIHPHRRAAAAGLAGALLSLAIEFIQSGLPGRYPSVLDVAANGLGAGLGAALILRAAQSRVSRIPT